MLASGHNVDPLPMGKVAKLHDMALDRNTWQAHGLMRASSMQKHEGFVGFCRFRSWFSVFPIKPWMPKQDARRFFAGLNTHQMAGSGGAVSG
jgi:hypothetical protein